MEDSLKRTDIVFLFQFPLESVGAYMSKSQSGTEPLQGMYVPIDKRSNF